MRKSRARFAKASASAMRWKIRRFAVYIRAGRLFRVEFGMKKQSRQRDFFSYRFTP